MVQFCQLPQTKRSWIVFFWMGLVSLFIESRIKPTTQIPGILINGQL